MKLTEKVPKSEWPNKEHYFYPISSTKILQTDQCTHQRSLKKIIERLLLLVKAVAPVTGGFLALMKKGRILK
jgi:hypothetical protein